VAVKLQFPILRLQTKIDLFVIDKLINLANWLCKAYKYEGIDFKKFNEHFQGSIVKELDFKQEVINADRTRRAFKSFDHLHIPKVYNLYSSHRVIVMEFVKGDKINEVEKLTQKYGDALKASKILINVFAQMIFKHGHVHCDAHPGNILVRPHPKNPKEPQIVLLDHGFYCDLEDDFRIQFCKLWYYLTTMDYYEVKLISDDLGMGEYFRYLPILFTYRTINSKKPLGGGPTKEEMEFLRGNDEVNFEKISFLLSMLPSEIIFIFKSMHIIGVHNRVAGGETRARLLRFCEYCIEALSHGSLIRWMWLWIRFYMRLFLFEYAFWAYRAIFGFLNFEFDEKNRLVGIK